MATEYLTVQHGAGKTVYFRFINPANGQAFDFGDNSWKANVAACADPKLEAAENADAGDGADSLYTAAADLALLNNTAAEKQIIAQAMDDLAADEIIGMEELRIVSGARLDSKTLTALVAHDASLTAVGSVVDFLKEVAEGDVTVDTSGAPWELVIKVKGTATERVRKKLYQADGTAVSAVSHIVGQHLENAL